MKRTEKKAKIQYQLIKLMIKQVFTKNSTNNGKLMRLLNLIFGVKINKIRLLKAKTYKNL